MDDITLDVRIAAKEDQQLARRVALGVDVQHFLRTPMAKELCERAEERRESCVDRLIRCHPDTPDALAMNRALRFEIAVIDYWQDGLAAIVNEGDIAEKEFIARHE